MSAKPNNTIASGKLRLVGKRTARAAATNTPRKPIKTSDLAEFIDDGDSDESDAMSISEDDLEAELRDLKDENLNEFAEADDSENNSDYVPNGSGDEDEEDGDEKDKKDVKNEKDEDDEEEAVEDEDDEAIVVHPDGSYSTVKTQFLQQIPASEAEKARQLAEDNKAIAEIAAMPGAKDAMLRRQVRFYTVIKRAKADGKVKEQTEIPVEEPRRSTLPADNFSIQACENGIWVEVEPPAGQKKRTKVKKHVRMLTSEEINRMGLQNHCQCVHCTKQRGWRSQFTGDIGKDAGSTRSNNRFKPDAGHRLGGE